MVTLFKVMFQFFYFFQKVCNAFLGHYLVYNFFLGNDRNAF